MKNDGEKQMDLNQWLQQFNLRGSNPTIIAGVDRDTLAKWFCEWGFTEGVEVGTRTGAYAEVLCASNPKLHLTCVDPWLSYDGYLEFVNQQNRQDKYYRVAKERLLKYNCSLIRKFSVDGAKDFPDESLDFVYIDGNHSLLYVLQDLYAWIPKIKKGGVISGHDYLWFEWYKDLQVVEALEAYIKANRIKQWYVLGRNRKPTTNPNKLSRYARSWMWVK